MGISLNGLTPAGTYPGLIKTGDNTAISGTPKVLSDGNGNNLPMEVSTTGVNLTGSPTVNSVAIANTTQVAAKQDTLVSGTNIKTINGASVLGSGNIVTPSTNPSGVSGAIQFSNGSAFASDATNLFWDDTNNRLGVGTNAPTGRTQITESFTTIANNYSAITFDGTITSRATASDTIFGFRNTQNIVATATGQTIIANDFTPNYTFFDGNTDNIALRIGGLKNTQNNSTAILMQQTATAGNNGLAIQPANSRWQMGFCTGQSNQISSARIVYAQNGVKIGTESSPPSTGLLEIRGSGSTSATTSLLVQNSAGVNSLQVKDDGSVFNYGKGVITSNTAFGDGALIANTSGALCTAYGVQALASNTNGQVNTAIGNQALKSNTSSSNNTAIGYSSMFLNNGGARNTAVGVESMYANTAGSDNTAIGIYTNSGNFDGSVILGRAATATASNQFVVGSSTTNAGAIDSSAFTQDKRWKVKINGVDYYIALQTA